MSDTTGAASSGVAHPILHSTPGPAIREVVHEAYSFACMRCGRGWEQSYDIEHHVDAEGKPFIVYRAGGERVPSPLSRPTCAACGSHVVRIMRSGQVTPFAARGNQPPAGPLVPAYDETPPGGQGATGRHRRHLSGLFHPFRHPDRPAEAGTAADAGTPGAAPAEPSAEASGAVAPDEGLRPPHRS